VLLIGAGPVGIELADEITAGRQQPRASWSMCDATTSRPAAICGADQAANDTVFVSLIA
jgi:hypothetical protein